MLNLPTPSAVLEPAGKGNWLVRFGDHYSTDKNDNLVTVPYVLVSVTAEGIIHDSWLNYGRHMTQDLRNHWSSV